jgi:hypothetical protein
MIASFPAVGVFMLQQPVVEDSAFFRKDDGALAAAAVASRSDACGRARVRTTHSAFIPVAPDAFRPALVPVAPFGGGVRDSGLAQ